MNDSEIDPDSEYGVLKQQFNAVCKERDHLESQYKCQLANAQYLSAEVERLKSILSKDHVPLENQVSKALLINIQEIKLESAEDILREFMGHVVPEYADTKVMVTMEKARKYFGAQMSDSSDYLGKQKPAGIVEVNHYDTVCKERDSLKAEVERLTNILGQDRLDDWKRIQDAEREVERLKGDYEIAREHCNNNADIIQSLKDIAESDSAKLAKAVEALEQCESIGGVNIVEIVEPALKLIKGHGRRY